MRENELEDKIEKLELELQEAKDFQRIQPMFSFIGGAITALIAYFILK